MVTSTFPAAMCGRVNLRPGSAWTGTAHEPGAIECPSDKAAIGGSPRTLTKVLRGSDDAGPTWMGNGICVADSATVVAAILMFGRPEDWHLPGSAPTSTSAAATNRAAVNRGS